MKKLSTLFVAFAMVSLSASAQEVNMKSKRGENMLPEKGDWALGFNADGIFEYVGNAFNNSGNDAPSVGYLQGGKFVGKMFNTDKKATRYIVNLRVGSFKENTAVDASTSTTGFELAVGYGKEWRRGKTRLQGFYGIDGMVGVSSSSSKTVNGANTTKNTEGLGVNVGANGFIGAEYFIFPKISFGAQYNYGLNVAFTGKSKTTVNGASTTNNDSSTGVALGGVGVASMSVFLHF